ncbi:MAG: hypothetical protein WKG07_00845 [Hymenobacter sp.]
MVAPLLRYGMRGIIWYQGESNLPRAGPLRPPVSGDGGRLAAAVARG